jgi:hypothetical protein
LTRSSTKKLAHGSPRKFFKNLSLWLDVLVRKTLKMSKLIVFLSNLIIKRAIKETKKQKDGTYKKTPFQIISAMKKT